MTEQRIIKKYPNRRLYDTAISSYITLEDVKRLVLESVPLMVIDARTQTDITHSTLLQIIIEQEEKGPHLFSNVALEHMIRYYKADVPSLLKQLFEEAILTFNQYEKQSEMVGEASEKHDVWQKLQAKWLEKAQAVTTETVAEAPPPLEDVKA